MSHQQQCLDFLDKRRALILSTQDPAGELETSVTPFVLQDGVFYIFISELAKHTQNLLWQTSTTNSSESTKISGLLLSDEAETEQLFARERMTFQFDVSEVSQSTATYNQILEQFENAFGEVVSILTSLPDFHLFALTSVSGGYVRGFGQAFAFKGMPEKGITPIKRS